MRTIILTLFLLFSFVIFSQEVALLPVYEGLTEVSYGDELDATTDANADSYLFEVTTADGNFSQIITSSDNRFSLSETDLPGVLRRIVEVRVKTIDSGIESTFGPVVTFQTAGATIEFCGPESDAYEGNNSDLLWEEFKEWREGKIQSKIAEVANYRADITDCDVAYRIPIVFHIVHDPAFPETNVPNAELLEQIDILNQEFNGPNANSLGGNACIEFCLAQNTPDGGDWLTDYSSDLPGVTRWSDADASDHGMIGDTPSLMDLVYFPPESYLNIYITRHVDNDYLGVTGYATFPGGAGEFDGIVQEYWSMSDYMPIPGYDQGFILVHEVGHYLSLYHTFQSNSCQISSPGCETDGDLCCDTPPAIGPNGDVCMDNTPNSCGVPEQLENYMDYSLEDCKNTFTENQIQRMHATLLSLRQSLVSNVNHINTGIAGPNGCASADLSAYFDCNASQFCLNSSVGEFTGIQAVDEWTISFSNPNGAIPSVSGTGTIPSATVSFPAIGEWIVTLTVENIITEPFGILSESKSVFVCECGAVELEKAQWYFGRNCAMDFTSGIAMPIGGSEINTGLGSASAADGSGNLLFYTDGQWIWNSNHQIMNPMEPMNSYVNEFFSSQPALIVPDPGDANMYYVFVTPGRSVNPVPQIGQELQYSLVDMTLNSGLGGLVSVNQSVSAAAPFITGHLGAIPHCDGEDYWIVVHGYSAGFEDKLLSYRLTSTGINATPVVSESFAVSAFDPAPSLSSAFAGRGSIDVSPNGELVAISTNRDIAVLENFGELFLYCFDRGSGQFDEILEIPHQFARASAHSFSGSGNFLFTSSDYGISQFDVRDISSCDSDLPRKYYPFSEDWSGTNYMQLGPDGKIYVSRIIGFNDWLSVINYPETWSQEPNAVGVNLRAFDIDIPGDGVFQSLGGLPNFIDAQPQSSSVVDFEWCSVDCENVTFKMTGCGADVEWDVLCDGTIDGDESSLDYAFSDPGTYCVSLTVDGQTVTHNVEIEIPETPQLSPDVACLNQATIYSSSNSEGLDYQWEVFGDGTIVGADDLSTVEVWWSGVGSITLTVTDELGCSNISTLSVSPADHTALASDDAEICLGESIQLQSLLPSASCSWTPSSDLDNPMSCTPMFTPAAAGVYTFVLSSISADGCVATDGVTITVIDNCCPSLEISVSPENAPWDISTYLGSSRVYTFTVTNTGGPIAEGDYTFSSDIIDEPSFLTNFWVDPLGTSPDPIWTEGPFSSQTELDDYLLTLGISENASIHIGASFIPLVAGADYHHSYSFAYGDGDCAQLVDGFEVLDTRVYYGCPWGWSSDATDCNEPDDQVVTCFGYHSPLTPDIEDGITDISFSFQYDPAFLTFDTYSMLSAFEAISTVSVNTSATSVPAPSGQMLQQVDIEINWNDPYLMAYGNTPAASELDFTVISGGYLCLVFNKVDVLPNQYPSNSTVISCTSHLVTLIDEDDIVTTQELGTDGAIVLFTDDDILGCIDPLDPPTAGFFQSPEVCFESIINFQAEELNGWHVWECAGIDPDNMEETFTLWGPDAATVEYTLEGNYEVTHYVTVDGVTSVETITLFVGVPSDPDLLEVTGNMTIDTDSEFSEGILVTSSGELTISNATLLFADGAGIIVEPGGRLTINNATLDKLPCADLWYGIDIKGNREENQHTYQGLVYQGKAVLDGATIQHAAIGLTNYDRSEPWYDAPSSGGVLDCENSYFIDCRTAVAMAPYKNMINDNRASDYSSFKNSDFTWTADFAYGDWIGLNPMMYLNGIKSLRIQACDFSNASTDLFTEYNWTAQRAAVWTTNGASINLRGKCTSLFAPCPGYINSTVKGFKYGLVLHGGKSSVRNTDFNNYRSIYNLHTKGSRFTSNNFGPLLDPTLQDVVTDYQTPEVWAGVSYGLYLDKSGAYWVEDNTFDKTGGIQKMLGLVIRSSGGYSNLVYDNDFLTNDYGSVSYDDNRGVDETQGLKYECNNFTDNIYGLSVTSIVDPQPGWGISHTQGVAGFSEELSGSSAGNIFDGAEVSDAYDMRNEFDADWVTYYAHPSDGISEVQGSILEENVWIDPHGPCPSGVSSGHVVKRSMADLEHDAAMELKGQLASLVDGGNTVALLSDVILAQYTEALELYYELMAESPNLSREVMLEAIEKEAELPAVLLTSILESNPHAAKSKAVEKKMDDRSSPLDEYQRYMIDQGKYLLSNKEKVESAYSQHLTNYETWMNQAITLVLEDDDIEDKISYIQSMIAGKESLAQRYLMIDLLIEAEEFTEASSLLSSIGTDFELKERKDQEYMDYQTCYDILISQKGLLKGDLTATEAGALQTIANKHATRAAGLAQLMLMQYGDDQFVEDLIDPELQEKSRRTFNPRKPTFDTDPSLNIYPNPADDHMVIEFRNWGGLCELMLIDAKGALVRTEIVDSNSSVRILNTSDLAPGTYELRLVSKLDPSLSHAQRIEIAH